VFVSIGNERVGLLLQRLPKLCSLGGHLRVRAVQKEVSLVFTDTLFAQWA
jgi:hypothetical protein